MKNFNLINHIQTPVAIIDKNMTIIEANNAYKQRNDLHKKVIGTKCFNVAYKFNQPCCYKTGNDCPVTQSFKTNKKASAIHHFWIDNHAVVEEVTSAPIIEDNGDVNYVVEEFRDVTKLLGLNKGIISICSYCKKLRNEGGQWLTCETYIQNHTGANFSHGICDNCNTSLLKK